MSQLPLNDGEAGTIADRTGRMFLLRRAQDWSRQGEAARHAAILDALPAHIALLDAEGTVFSVNAAWRQVSESNPTLAAGCRVGANYLELCYGAQYVDSPEALETAEGIRSVLRGATRRFSIEYPCHSATEDRWFELVATPHATGSFDGVVLMRLDITGRKRSAEALLESEREQRQLAQALEVERSSLVAAQRIAKVGSWETDLATLSVTWSEETHRIHGTAPESFHPTHASFLKLVHPDDRAAVDEAFLRSAQQRDACSIRHRVVLPDGEVKVVEERWQVFFDTEENPVRAVGTCQDITERTAAEEKIRRLNRVYAVLSRVSTLIVRAQDRDELFSEACRIAAEEGGFPMAMIAIRDPVNMKIVPVASAGKDDRLMAAIRARLSSADAASNTMVARAMRGKTPVISNDSRSDPQVAFASRYAECGVRSMAVLPLLVADDAVGVLALYSSEVDFFHMDELRLLVELAADVAFAIDHLDKQARIDYVANYDLLTGLANRTLFLSRAGQYMRSAVSGGPQLALCLIDLERFKNINDTLGQAAGDALLRQVAELLTRTIGDRATVARVGADHFAVLLPGINDAEEAVRLLEESMQVFHEHPFHLNDGIFRISAKAGIALFPNDGANADMLYSNAESALKKAKTGGDQYLFYTQTMTETVAGRLTLENQLRQALDREEFVLHYQPKLSLETGKVIGAEALIRWNDPRTGLVPPGQFIPVLEETGLIHEVGRWALRKAVEDYLRWRAAGLAAVRVAVNVSSLQLRSQGFISQVEQAVGSDAFAASGLELEITESMIMGDMAQSNSVLHAIRAMGVTIAIDDFGTGFSSLGYLSKLPVDSLKIDRSFVAEMTATQEGLALVSTIITLAHSLKLKVVAEGVETEDQSRLLRLLRCDEMQGFLFSKAVPVELFESRFLVPASAG
ncbi:MAG: EAL domain-containing protein [Betaproteobacteria bacterium]